MAVPPSQTVFHGRSVATATFVFAALAVMAAAPAQAARQWGGEPAASVLVESGAGGQVIHDHAVTEAVPSDPGTVVESGDFGGGQVFISSDGGCPSCTGAGCDQCCPSALFDVCGCGKGHGKKACWIGRADALILWRDAPPDRPLLNNSLVAGPLLNANGLDSEAAAGPRFSIFRLNNCTGHAVEATYLRAANFRSMRPLSAVSAPYTLASPGIFGNAAASLTDGDANLGSRLQSFELNRHHGHGQHLRFLAGFRWIEWQEQFTLQGTGAGAETEFYQTNCFNDLYGGQIGLDANVLATPWIRFDGVVKAGVYYNNAVQSSQYSTTNPNNPGSVSVAIGESPLSGAFAGEVGLTGVVPVTSRIDVRVGYFGLWLSGIAQPTQQLSGQTLQVGQTPAGTLNANGGVLVQGVSLGLEGRW